jgi:hypothetical protein
MRIPEPSELLLMPLVLIVQPVMANSLSIIRKKNNAGEKESRSGEISLMLSMPRR